MALSDSTWITLRAGLRDLLLQEHRTPYNIVCDLENPDKQTPQMISMIGGESKSLLMKRLKFGSDIPSLVGQVQLRVDINGLKNESPVIFADCNLHTAPSIVGIRDEKPTAHIYQHPLLWYRGISQALDSTTLAHLVYSKLLAPFSTIVCFVAEDLGGLGATAGLIALWLTSFNNTPSDLPTISRPRVLVLTRCEDPTTFDEEKATKRFMLHLWEEAAKKQEVLAGMNQGRLDKVDLDTFLAKQFEGVRVVGYPAPESASRSWRLLAARMLVESEHMQKKRKEALAAFSATHFTAFFHLACSHFSADLASPFSFIKASRNQDPPSTEFSTHLSYFIKQVPGSQLLNFAVHVIASAFVFDGYPPYMHGFFPENVFKQIYHDICREIDPYKDVQGHDGSFNTQFTNGVRLAFSQYALEIIRTGDDGGAYHRSVIRGYKDLWRDIDSNTTCLSCLARCPEDTLTCLHSLCSVCTECHGQSSAAEPETFWIHACPFCSRINENKFRHKPKTAGVRALIAEGGGIKGIVPLSFLAELEAAVDLPMNIQEHFDIGYGSSSGALIILGLFAKNWSVQECTQRFESLSSLAFRKRSCFGFQLPQFGLFQKCLNVCLSLVTDSRYSSAGITEALQSAFGEERTLFEYNCGGAKIGVVATTTEDSSNCILTNYNGPQQRPSSCGYLLIRPEERGQEILLWQAGRASSAAPPYFKSFLGYQDGGLGGHNNPINLALWEQDIIWSRQKKHPDIVVSLGTGFARESENDANGLEKPSFFRARCVPRLFRSFLKTFNGEIRWQELQNSLLPELRNRYHRLNIEFFGDEPELDDLQVMPNLKKQALLQASSSADIGHCADNLLAALFYIKLLALPILNGSLFVCHARILCRIGPSHLALRVLARRLLLTNAHFYLDFEQKLPCVTPGSYDAIQSGSSFSQTIKFTVTSLQAAVDIKIDGITRRARSISNCPYVITTLVEDDGLHYSFGSRKGRKRCQAESDQMNVKRTRFRRS